MLRNQDANTENGRAVVGLHNVKSVEKAFIVLETLRDARRSLSLSELVSLSGLDKSAVQRFTRTLRDVGYLRQNPKTRQYELSARVLDLSFSYLISNELVNRAAPGLIRLRVATNERVDLSMVDADSLIYLFRLQSKPETVTAALVGRRVPMYCTAGGRAVMARMPEDEARALLDRVDLVAYTASTITDPDAIMEEVRRTRERGFAIQADEWRIGEIVVASAIVNHSGNPVGALHIVGSTGEWSFDEFSRRMGSKVAVAAQDASL
jgi:DNA-binding IclR family transcriptional regulator